MKRRTLILGAAATLAGYGLAHGPAAATPAPPTAAAKAIAWAAAQAGKSYLYGATGPGSFDCSGLVMEAYAHVGITIQRTAAGQWAVGPRVTSPQPGDLVFFPGADGTPFSGGRLRGDGLSGCVSAAQRLTTGKLPCATGVVQLRHRRVA